MFASLGGLSLAMHLHVASYVLAAFGLSSHLSCGRGQQGAKAYVLAPHFVQNYCGQDAKAYVLALLGCNMHLLASAIVLVALVSVVELSDYSSARAYVLAGLLSFAMVAT